MTSGLDDTLAFVKVVQEGSFTAAAQSLRLPKATFSRRVQELEHRLSVQLLQTQAGCPLYATSLRATCLRLEKQAWRQATSTKAPFWTNRVHLRTS
ncbi:LysR family transcriptional regulator [Microvirga pakistanensis]|uniref:LysR family transcriptional regulator n=1 Tax=Microvirga pakistanensis TaxID=1682650 RepID=UPI00106BB67F|nr:LysR family transcriptional regulator [Microvirga pakistanensis]